MLALVKLFLASQSLFTHFIIFTGFLWCLSVAALRCFAENSNPSHTRRTPYMTQAAVLCESRSDETSFLNGLFFQDDSCL